MCICMCVCMHAYRAIFLIFHIFFISQRWQAYTSQIPYKMYMAKLAIIPSTAALLGIPTNSNRQAQASKVQLQEREREWDRERSRRELFTQASSPSWPSWPGTHVSHCTRIREPTYVLSPPPYLSVSLPPLPPLRVETFFSKLHCE